MCDVIDLGKLFVGIIWYDEPGIISRFMCLIYSFPWRRCSVFYISTISTFTVHSSLRIALLTLSERWNFLITPWPYIPWALRGQSFFILEGGWSEFSEIQLFFAAPRKIQKIFIAPLEIPIFFHSPPPQKNIYILKKIQRPP